MKILITGGSGFIGSAVIRFILSETSHSVINLDKLTYASNSLALEVFNQNEKYYFEQVDICNFDDLGRVFSRYQPDVVMHLAAESHVDRSINGPARFIQTNIVGTYNLLEVSKYYWQNLSEDRKSKFRFHHISTDEVYGDLADSSELFSEDSPYQPSSPYSASKASSDHLVRAWGRTYGLPYIITNCSNNYGPYQHTEKLIPAIISNALKGESLPIYGNGLQSRDWLYVDDHARALMLVLERGQVCETYNIGGQCEKTNLDVVKSICGILEEIYPNKSSGIQHYVDLIQHVQDRAGHDVRYAVDISKMKSHLGWGPIESFESGLRKTVKWYIEYFQASSID